MFTLIRESAKSRINIEFQPVIERRHALSNIFIYMRFFAAVFLRFYLHTNAKWRLKMVILASYSS